MNPDGIDSKGKDLKYYVREINSHWDDSLALKDILFESMYILTRKKHRILCKYMQGIILWNWEDWEKLRNKVNHYVNYSIEY